MHGGGIQGAASTTRARLAGGRAGRAEAGKRLRRQRQRHGGGAGPGARLPRPDPNSLFPSPSAVIGYTQQYT